MRQDFKAVLVYFALFHCTTEFTTPNSSLKSNGSENSEAYELTIVFGDLRLVKSIARHVRSETSQ